MHLQHQLDDAEAEEHQLEAQRALEIIRIAFVPTRGQDLLPPAAGRVNLEGKITMADFVNHHGPRTSSYDKSYCYIVMAS